VRPRNQDLAQEQDAEDGPRYSIQRRRNGRWLVLVEEIDASGVAIARCERSIEGASPVDRLAKFIPYGDGLRVLDLGGGVYRRIREPTVIDDGVRLRIGRQTLTFRAGRLLREIASGGPPPCLELLTPDGGPGPRFPLLGSVTVVGRKGACADIALVEDNLVSARHVSLRITGHQVLAEDLQSRNGSYVQLSDGSSIRPGEVILVGRYRLRASLANDPTS
jgi:hypothetical protein